MRNFLFNIQGITPNELFFLQNLTQDLNEEQQKEFVYFYSSKRRSEQDILLFTLIGFIGIAGIQRFMVGQIGFGIIYLVTCGLCFIGTIVDLINYKQIAENYNNTAALESMQMVNAFYKRT